MITLCLCCAQFKTLLMRLDPSEEDSDLSDGRESPVGDAPTGEGEVC